MRRNARIEIIGDAGVKAVISALQDIDGPNHKGLAQTDKIVALAAERERLFNSNKPIAIEIEQIALTNIVP